MLRRLRIGGRLNMLIALPLLALVAFATLAYFAVDRASVRGDSYQSLRKALDLRADTSAPPANLLESWAEVNRIGVLAASPDAFSDAGVAQIQDHLALIQQSRVRFEAAMTLWASQQLDETTNQQLLSVGRQAGTEFFQEIETQLKPAITAKDVPGVLAAISAMEPKYQLQQAGVERALAWAVPEVNAREKSAADDVTVFLFYASAATALLFLLSLLFSVVVRRSIVDPIRGLAERARSVATEELPSAVLATQESASVEAVPRLPRFEVDAHDELAELGASFNAVQDVALDLAAEQVIARRVVSENLVNIARRNQNLLGRTLGFISSLEQGERDAEALDNLFRIDHLTTRMRRNAQSLLVLAGAEPTQLWSPPVPVGDVVRAALSEVENYGQVDLGDLGAVSVVGSAAGDVSHLLAELLENATSFSPPTSAVTVVGRTVADGHQLAIFDYGLGMTPDELADANQRLNQVAAFDRESNKLLGFQVVARLAARHEIKVMLTTTPGGNGVTAVVRLPKSLLGSADTTSADSMSLADLPSAAERLSEPLPLTGATPESLVLPLGELTPEALPTTTLAGLTKRVPGAQLSDPVAAAVVEPPARSADDVRSTLASLQRGIDRGRQQADEG